MALSNPNAIVTEQNLSDFYQGILPYLGASGSVPTPKIYGFHISSNETVPSTKVQYLADAIGMTPAYMNFSTGVFDYGSWSNAFFMPKPCMLKYDGTMDYYLDPNDYTKKADGSASDVANESYAGNAMMEWPKIWLKIVPDTAVSGTGASIYISNEKIDAEYTDWNFHNYDGQSVNHFYTPIYNGSLINGKLRSISGKHVSNVTTAQQELDYAAANNPSGSLIWTTEIIADIDLINILLILISKSTNMQSTFGLGLVDGGSSTINNNFLTGVHNDKGLFYGTNSGGASTYTNAVKIFGMENWWGLHWRRVAGEVGGKRKLTYNTEDGSTTVGYNTTGSGYVTVDAGSMTGSSGDYLSKISYTTMGLCPISTTNGSSSTNYCDGFWYDSSSNVYTLIGGHSNHTTKAGAFCKSVYDAPTRSEWNVGASISARPLS